MGLFRDYLMSKKSRLVRFEKWYVHKCIYTKIKFPASMNPGLSVRFLDF